nr:thiamine ABC transporter substrate-binding protein [Actinomycetales bacterium]
MFGPTTPPRHTPPRTTTARAALTAAAAFALLAGCTSSTSPTTTGAPDDGTRAASSSTPSGSGTATDGTEVRLVTHESFDLPEALLAEFTAETGYKLEFVRPGDAGAMVSQLILTKNSPLGDAVFGIDNTFASRAVAEGVLEPYTSPSAVAGIDDLDGHLTAIDQGDVCLNIDRLWFAENNVPEPTDLDDLIRPEYEGLTVITNPATSSPGLAFLFATIAEFGESEGEYAGWQQYWSDLLANGTRVADGWSDAYYVDFTPYEGDRPIVLSYSSSPAAEVQADGTARTANVDASCFRQVEYAGVLTGAENPEGARALVDWLLSVPVQEEIPGSMYMYPVDPDAQLPAEWAEFASLSEDPLALDPADIAANRDAWLQEWLALIG